MPLFRTRTIWWPTWQGWILILLLFAGAFAALMLNVHRFLAVTERAPGADVLVVEAWAPEVVIRAAAREYAEGKYRLLLTNDVRSPGDEVDPSRTQAATRLLASLGVPADRIVVCPVPATDSHRSRAMAAAVRETLVRNGIKPRGLNTVAPAAHARKSLLAYRRALASSFPVGIIAVPTGDYDPARWWKSSQGAKWVVANGVGWLYEKFSGSGP